MCSTAVWSCCLEIWSKHKPKCLDKPFTYPWVGSLAPHLLKAHHTVASGHTTGSPSAHPRLLGASHNRPYWIR